MLLQLAWLQFESRGPVGVGWMKAAWGPKTQNRAQIYTKDPGRTSENLKLQQHDLHPRPYRR